MTSFTFGTDTSIAVKTGAGKRTIANFAAEVLRWYERARQRSQLKQLDDRLLDDIGVTRAQAEAEARKPGWTA